MTADRDPRTLSWPLPQMECRVPHDAHTLRKARRWVAFDPRLSSRERHAIAKGLNRLEAYLERTPCP